MFNFKKCNYHECNFLVGMLPLTFENAADYDKIKPSDRISLIGLSNIAPGKVSSIFSQLFIDDKYSIRLIPCKIVIRQKNFSCSITTLIPRNTF